jgi:hypothetical protein
MKGRGVRWQKPPFAVVISLYIFLATKTGKHKNEHKKPPLLVIFRAFEI